jgi:N-methylhydantoinase B
VKDVIDDRVSHTAAERLYGVVVVKSRVDEDATAALRAQLRDRRLNWERGLETDLPKVAVDAARAPVGDRLSMITATDGSRVFGCDCGQLLAPSTANWKLYARRSLLDAEDLGNRVRLHPGLVAEGFACPGCGALLGTEVRAADDAVLHDFAID